MILFFFFLRLFTMYATCRVLSVSMRDFHFPMMRYNGQEGVELGIKILQQELRITMALAG